MDKKTMLKIFGGAFLRSLIVLMAVTIIGFGAFFIIKVNTDKNNDIVEDTGVEDTEYSPNELEALVAEDNANNANMSTEEVVTEAVTTEEVTTEAPNIPSTDKNILILNSTSTSGLASAWASKLNGAGFGNTGFGNYSASTEESTKIYVSEEGMGNDLIGYFNGATVIVGSVESSTYSVKSGNMDHYDIYIVIGNSDSSVQ